MEKDDGAGMQATRAGLPGDPGAARDLRWACVQAQSHHYQRDGNSGMNTPPSPRCSAHVHRLAPPRRRMHAAQHTQLHTVDRGLPGF